MTEVIQTDASITVFFLQSVASPARTKQKLHLLEVKTTDRRSRLPRAPSN